MFFKKTFKLSLIFLLYTSALNSAYSDCSADGLSITNTSDGSHTAKCLSNISMGGSTASIQLSNYPTISSGSVSFGDSINTINTTNISLGNTAYGIFGNSYPTIAGGSASIGSTSNIITTGNISAGISSYGISFNNYGGVYGGTGSVGITTNIISAGNISLGNASYGIDFNNRSGVYGGTGSLGDTSNNISAGYIYVGDNSYGIKFLNYPGVSGSGSVGNINNTFSANNITSGNNSYGIQFSNYPSVSGSGSIGNINNTFNVNNITSGNNSYGIQFWNYPAVTNTGSFGNITNTFNINGNISTGDNSSSISLKNYPAINSGSGSFSAIDNIFNINGNISTGTNSYGIYLFNNPTKSGGTGSFGEIINIVNISGRISVPSLTSYAIYADNSSSISANTVQLNKGSSIIGVIYGTGVGANKLNLNLGAGASYSFATTGFTVSDLNGRPMVTGSAYAAGVGNITTASQSLYERTSQITQSLDDRVRTYDAKQNTSQDFWVNTYYSDSGRGGQGLSGSNLSFNQYRSGITAGFNVKNSYTPTELIMNYEHGKLNIDEGNQGISSNSVMAGVLFPDIKKLFTGTLSAKALVGYSDFSGDRKVLTNDVALNGSRNVTASYQSTHLTLGSAWTKTLYQTDKVLLDTLVGVDLNTQHINSYSESDLFKWNGRTINQLQERVTLGMEMKPLVNPLTLYGRLGIERRDLISGENQNYAINNTAVSYNDSNQRNTYATLNAGAYYPLTQTVRAYAQVRYYDSTKNIDALSGSIGISGQF